VRTARRLGFDGLNLTHPVKQTVLPHLDELGPDAAALGAVNTVVFEADRAIGHNTDWAGFHQSFVRGLPDAPLRTVVLLGAGGAGAAATYALLGLGADRIVVIDTEPRRAEKLASRFGRDRVRPASPAELEGLLPTADGLVHATPTGMAQHPGLPLPAALLRPELWVAEIVYRPLETELIRAARAAGCRTLDGGGMVVYQAARAFELFTGVTPDAERMLAHLTTLV
jgi:shikimate dehydrogenase